jgi:hypothetical protein
MHLHTYLIFQNLQVQRKDSSMMFLISIAMMTITIKTLKILIVNTEKDKKRLFNYDLFDDTDKDAKNKDILSGLGNLIENKGPVKKGLFDD